MTADTARTTTEHEEPSMTTTEVPLPPAADAAATADPRPGGGLAALLRSERIKVTTVRADKVLLAVAASIGLLTSWATATFVTDEGLTVTDVFVYPTLLTSVLAAVSAPSDWPSSSTRSSAASWTNASWSSLSNPAWRSRSARMSAGITISS